MALLIDNNWCEEKLSTFNHCIWAELFDTCCFVVVVVVLNL